MSENKAEAKAAAKAPHWHLLGAGSVGTLFADYLREAGHTVSAFVRDETAGNATLSIELVRGETATMLQLPVTRRDSDATVTHLLVTTKSYDVLPAVAGVAHLLAEQCQVVLLTNGMGLVEALAQRFPHLALYCGTTTEGAYREAPGRVVHAGKGETRIGRHGGGPPPGWFEHWQRALARCTWDEDIPSALWAKLAVNCVINPLTAIYRCRNGELATIPEAAADVAALCREVQQVSYAGGYTATAQTLPDTVAKVIEGTAANRSSMLQDVMHGRKTEIGDITGYLVQEARRYGIPTPRNEQVMEAVLAL
jgi:2-dehydropantoate 2-reductase